MEVDERAWAAMPKISRRLLIIGPTPPPRGGVSVHIERLAHLLRGAGLDVAIIDESPNQTADSINIRKIGIFRYLRELHRSDIVHIHSSIDALRILHTVVALAMRKKTVVTIHSWRGKSGLTAFLHKLLMPIVDTLICVNAEIGDHFGSRNVRVMPAFLPPVFEVEAQLPNDLVNWIGKSKAAGKTLISSNASQLELFGGEDLYGLDMCIELMNSLRQKDVALVFVVASLKRGGDRFERYRKMISEHGLSNDMLLIHGENLSYVRLIIESDIVIRATNTDGDSLTVREALHLGKKVVASDVIGRPSGAVSFKNRDQLDLNRVVLSVMPPAAVENSDPVEESALAETYLDFYGCR
jgi:glycosyltransferase involved in cell wall biosynthesis